MTALLQISPERLFLLFGLSFFFGLAFEEFYGEQAVKPPGGVRTFPLLALLGGGLFAVGTDSAVPFAVGLLALGAWLFVYYRNFVQEARETKSHSAGLMIPVCNLLAYLLGPLVLWAPIWVGVSVTVAAVLLLSARESLHALAHRIPQSEIVTLGKFLILTGIVLPLLPNEPVTALTTITPYQVWLAVIAVSVPSYASYLAQRYVSPARGSLLAALLGGLYSSTATTVVLARRMRGAGDAAQLEGGIVLATAVMYLRIAALVFVFNLALGKALFPALLLLALIAAALAFWCSRRGGGLTETAAASLPANPLEIGTALLFAATFVVISLVASWAAGAFGAQGLYSLAAITGVTDIDPFVLTVAQGTARDAGLAAMTVAVMVAVSSNNLLKAVYALGFSGGSRAWRPAAALIFLALAGGAFVYWTMAGPA